MALEIELIRQFTKKTFTLNENIRDVFVIKSIHNYIIHTPKFLWGNDQMQCLKKPLFFTPFIKKQKYEFFGVNTLHNSKNLLKGFLCTEIICTTTFG